MGLEVLIILPLAPEEDPVINSPLVNTPVDALNVNVGASASDEVSSESYTPTSLKESALPRDIVLSVGLVPKASVAPVSTLTCFIKVVVLDLALTPVFNSVASILTLAPLPKTP